MPIGATPQIQKEMLMDWGINLEDILAFFVCVNLNQYL